MKIYQIIIRFFGEDTPSASVDYELSEDDAETLKEKVKNRWDGFPWELEIQVHPVDIDHMNSVVEQYHGWVALHAKEKAEATTPLQKAHCETAEAHCSNKAKHYQSLIDQLEGSD